MSLEKDTEGILKIIPTKSKSPNAPNTLSVDWLLMGIQLAHQMQSIHEGKERRTVLHIDRDEEAKQQAPQRIHRPVADHRVYRSRCAKVRGRGPSYKSHYKSPTSVGKEPCFYNIVNDEELCFYNLVVPNVHPGVGERLTTTLADFKLDFDDSKLDDGLGKLYGRDVLSGMVVLCSGVSLRDALD